MTIPLPPRYVMCPATVKYARTVPAELRDFFASLYGLAWASKYVSTPPLEIAELLDFLGISSRTYNEYVKALCGLGWLRSTTDRSGCVRFDFPQTFPIPSSPITIQAAKALDPKAIIAESCTSPQNPAYSQNSAISREEEEEDLMMMGRISSTSSTSSSSSSSQPQEQAHKLRLLQAAGVRQKHIAAILADGEINLELILAECARTYENERARDKGFCIGANLVKHDFPEATYFRRCERIPAAILERAGLANLLPEPAADDDEPDLPEDEDDALAAGKAPEISVDDRFLDQVEGRLTIRQAWAAALAQLGQEIPKATFERWVSGSRAVDYADGYLVVLAGNELQRAWLEDRLTSTLVRLMSGLLCRSVEIEFVTPENAGASEIAGAEAAVAEAAGAD